MLGFMSEQPANVPLPKWDLADRLRKSLRESGVSVREMAAALDVGQNTVSTWINGHIAPSTRTVQAWALRTGIPYTWFCHGSAAPCDLAPAIPQRRRGSNNMQNLPSRLLA